MFFSSNKNVTINKLRVTRNNTLLLTLLAVMSVAPAMTVNAQGSTETQTQAEEVVEVSEPTSAYEVTVATEETCAEAQSETANTETQAVAQQAEAPTEAETQSAEDTRLGKSLGNFKLTGYCACRKCNGKWTGSPTALGTKLTPGRTIAVDPKVIPLGSWVYININGEGWHKYRAEDTGSAIKGHRIDVCAPSHSECRNPKYNATVEVRLAK
jgi:3D (Asp-Asp-Asp) domain-containing protein